MIATKLDQNFDRSLNLYEQEKKVESKPLLGGAASSCLNFTMDLTGQVQGGFEMTSALQQQFGYLSLKIFGVTSILSLITGPMSAAQGYEEFKLSQRVKDLSGEVIGWLKTVQGGLQTIAGALFIPASALEIALYFVVSKTVLLASRIFGQAGSIALTIGSILLMIGSCISLIEQVQIRQQVAEILDEEDLPIDDRYHKVVEMLQEKASSPKERRELERIFGEKFIKEIRSATSETSRQLVEKCLRICDKKIALSVFYLVLGVLGTVLTIISFIFTMGTSALVFAVIGSVISLIWLIADIDAMADSFKANEKGQIDHKWMLFSTILCIVLVALALIFCSTEWGMIFSLIIGGILLTAHLVCYARMNMPELSEKKAMS